MDFAPSPAAKAAAPGPAAKAAAPGPAFAAIWLRSERRWLCLDRFDLSERAPGGTAYLDTPEGMLALYRNTPVGQNAEIRLVWSAARPPRGTNGPPPE